MAQQILEKKPERWDVPFWQEVADPSQRREMSEAVVEQLLARPPFSQMNAQAFPANVPLRGILANDCRISRFQRGDVVIREGDYGNSAFLVLQGTVGVAQKGLDAQELGRRKTQRKSLIASMVGALRGPRAAESRDAKAYPQRGDRDEAAARGGFLQDVAGVTRVGDAKLGAATLIAIPQGQTFGELAALGRIPRTATVVALEPATLLEVRWQGLRELRKYDDALRRVIDDQYRRYGLRTILLDSELLSHVSDEDQALRILDELVKPENSEFETYGSFDWYGTYQQWRESQEDPLAMEPVVAQEGTATNGVILIRAGFARLSRRYGNGEQTFDYLGKGRLYGMQEVLQEVQTGRQAPLRATLRAVGYLDVVRISTRAFETLILPHLPNSMSHRPRAADRVTDVQSLNPSMVEFLVENRLINARAAMLIDLDRCTRCDDCVRACASGHDNNPRFVRHGPTHGHYMVANACMHCADPVCMIGCPTGAIHRAPDGEVVINDVTCIGCETCARNCPYSNIRMVHVRDRDADDALLLAPGSQRPIVKATKCDLCVDHAGGPACARACPHDALTRIDLQELEALPEWLERSSS